MIILLGKLEKDELDVQLGGCIITKWQCHSMLINGSSHLTNTVPGTVPNVEDTNMKVIWPLFASVEASGSLEGDKVMS